MIFTARLRSTIAALSLVAFLLPVCALAGDDEKILQHAAFQRVNPLITEGKYEEAVAAANEALEKYPKASLGYMLRATANVRAGHLDAAGADAERALQYSSGTSYAKTVRDTMARLYEYRGLQYAIKQDFARSATDFSHAIELNPELDWAYVKRGYAEYKLGDYRAAIRDLSHPARDVPIEFQVLVHTFLGRSHLKLGDPEKARAEVAAILQLDPRLNAKYAGENQLAIYDTEKRRQAYVDATAAAEAAEKAGNSLEAFQRYEDAWHWPLVVIDIPNQPDIDDYNSADVAAMRKVEDALRRLYPKLPAKPALPEDARRFGVQAAVAAREQRYDEATALFKRGQRIAPWWPQANFNLAVLAAKKEKLPEAISYMKTYLALAPDAPDAREAQDKIYEWEVGADPKRGPKIDTLAGTWVGKLTVSNLTVSYWYDLVPTGENQFEMTPTRMYSRLTGATTLSRAQSGYYSAKLNGTKVDFIIHDPSGRDVPAAGEFAADFGSFTLTMTDKGKTFSMSFAREK